MARLHIMRALVGGLFSTIASATVLYVLAPLFGVPRLDLVASLAAGAGVLAHDPARVAVIGWTLLLAAGLAGAFLFALLWDVLPPRTRPISKALVFVVLALLAVGAPHSAWPAALTYALSLGLIYRPHPAPPDESSLRAVLPIE